MKKKIVNKTQMNNKVSKHAQKEIDKEANENLENILWDSVLITVNNTGLASDIREIFKPEDLFLDSQLHAWALENGYVKNK